MCAKLKVGLHTGKLDMSSVSEVVVNSYQKINLIKPERYFTSYVDILPAEDADATKISGFISYLHNAGREERLGCANVMNVAAYLQSTGTANGLRLWFSSSPI